jgi:riboflavin transporter 2
MLLLSSIGLLLAAVLWQTTSIIADRHYSIWLFISIFIMAVPSTTSDLLCMPYMARYRQQYLTTFFVGMGCSALVPSAVSLIQGKSIQSQYSFNQDLQTINRE